MHLTSQLIPQLKTKNLQEIHGIYWVKKDKQGNNNPKGRSTMKWVPQTRTTRSMTNNLLEDQAKNTKMSHDLDKPTKKCIIQSLEINPRSTPELDTSQQTLYEYLENKEEEDEDPPINDKGMSQDNNMNQNGMLTTTYC